MLAIKGSHVSAYGRSYRTPLRSEGAKQHPKLYRLSTQTLLFLFQGGSALSPAAVISSDRAQQQVAALAKEVGCPTSSIQEVISCLRQKPANILNDAQTKVGTGVQVGEEDSLLSLQMEGQGLKMRCDDHLQQATHSVHNQLNLSSVSQSLQEPQPTKELMKDRFFCHLGVLCTMWNL